MPPRSFIVSRSPSGWWFNVPTYIHAKSVPTNLALRHPGHGCEPLQVAAHVVTDFEVEDVVDVLPNFFVRGSH